MDSRKYWGKLEVLDGAARTPKAPSALSAPVGGAANLGSLPGYSILLQEQTNWCWAAVSLSLANYYKTTGWTQCTLVKQWMPQNCCGSAGPVHGPNGCNNPWNLDQPLTLLNHYRHRAEAPALFAQLQREIAADQPMGCRIQWTVGAHFVSLSGWSVDNAGIEWVDVGDPVTGFEQVPYADLVNAYHRTGVWSNSYYTIAAGPPVGGSVIPSTSYPVAP